jgi:hypothetical protein
MIQQKDHKKHDAPDKKEEPVLDTGTVSEAEWRQWQISYGVRRRKIFSRIREALRIRRTRLS